MSSALKKANEHLKATKSVVYIHTAAELYKLLRLSSNKVIKCWTKEFATLKENFGKTVAAALQCTAMKKFLFVTF